MAWHEIEAVPAVPSNQLVVAEAAALNVPSNELKPIDPVLESIRVSLRQQ